MTAALRKTEQDVIAEAARRAFDDAGGDVKAAVAMLETAVRQSRGLRDALTEPLLAAACYDAVRRQVHVERKRVWSPSVATERFVPSKVSGAYRVIQLAAGTLLMFPLPGGKRLGEATRVEIEAAAEFYERQATDMATKARWLRLVADAMPATATAGKVFTDERLRELQAEAGHG